MGTLKRGLCWLAVLSGMKNEVRKIIEDKDYVSLKDMMRFLSLKLELAK